MDRTLMRHAGSQSQLELACAHGTHRGEAGYPGDLGELNLLLFSSHGGGPRTLLSLAGDVNISFQHGDGHVVNGHVVALPAELEENYRLIGFPGVVYDVVVSTHALEIIYLPTLMRPVFSGRIPESIMGHMLSFVSAARFKISGYVDVSFDEEAEQTVPLALTPYEFDVYSLTGNGVHRILSQARSVPNTTQDP